MLKRHDVPVYISKYEALFLRPKSNNLVDVLDKEQLTLGNITFDVLHAPGHTRTRARQTLQCRRRRARAVIVRCASISPAHA